MPNIKVLNDSMKAAEDYSDSANQFRFVYISDEREVKMAENIGDPAYGILQNLPETNQAAEVAVMGVSQLALAGTVTANDKIVCNASGYGVAATTSQTAMAIARENGASGEQISVFIIPGGDEADHS